MVKQFTKQGHGTFMAKVQLKEPEGDFRYHEEFLKIKYSPDDIRYTTKNDVIFAIVLGWPGSNKEILFKSFSENEWQNARKIRNVSLLGSNEKIVYQLNSNGLMVKTPTKSLNEMAIVFKVELE